MTAGRPIPDATRSRLRLFAIVFLAFALRMAGLGREGLWYDEAFTLRFARRSFAGMIELLVREAWDPPVYPSAIWAWVRLVGAGDWQARLVSAIFGTLAVLALHGLARRLFDRRTADLAAFLAAISQFLIAYSQEARCYALLLFLLLAASSAYLDALRPGTAGRRWWAFVLLAAVATLTHYFAVFFLFPIALHSLSARARAAVTGRRLAAGIVLYALLLAPWLASGVLRSAAGQPVAHFERVAPWFSVDALSFARTLNDFHGGRMAGMLARAPTWTYPLGALLFGVPALLALRPLAAGAAAAGARSSTLWLVLVAFVPMTLVIALAFARIQFAPRYVLFCCAPYLVLVARGLATLPPVPRRAFLAAILAWSALSLRALYAIPQKEDWRGALRELALGVRPGDRVLFLPFGERPLEWSVYHPDGPQIDVVALDEPERLEGGRLWVLAYERVPVADPRFDRAREILRRRRAVRASERFLVRLELYEPGKR